GSRSASSTASRFAPEVGKLLNASSSASRSCCATVTLASGTLCSHALHAWASTNWGAALGLSSGSFTSLQHCFFYELQHNIVRFGPGVMEEARSVKIVTLRLEQGRKRRGSSHRSSRRASAA